MAPETSEQELARLRAENEALKQKPAAGTLSLKVSAKGAVSIYGLGRFPVTLYKEQWRRVADKMNDILDFIETNNEQLKTKPVRE